MFGQGGVAVRTEAEIGSDTAPSLKVPILPLGHVFRGSAGTIVMDSHIVINLADSSGYIVGRHPNRPDIADCSQYQ